jgi:hypothetical protein
MTVWLRAAATTVTFTAPSDLAADTVITSTHGGFGGAALRRRCRLLPRVFAQEPHHGDVPDHSRHTHHRDARIS